jgi:acetyl esterase/lipase
VVLISVVGLATLRAMNARQLRELDPVLVVAVCSLFFGAALNSRAEIKEPVVLWPEGAPGALGTNAVDIPTLTPYLADPKAASGAALVVCPGGSYWRLSPREGEEYAVWLNEHGVSALVLQYRLGSNGYRHPRMLEDAMRGMRLARAKAAEWGIDPKRVGIMGSSAGGHLAATLLTHFDTGKPEAAEPIERQSCRPDFGVLCYPVITMGQYAHAGSKRSLLGDNPSPELVKLLSNELQVTAQTPPCFIWHTYEDQAVPVENSLVFAEALRQACVPFDLHIYQHGGHGLALAGGNHPWLQDLLFWLKAQGFLK